MTLHELLVAVREENLGRSQLESYEQKLSALYAQYMVRIGELKKERALYFLERQKPDVTDISIRRLWDAGTLGQELIELECNVKAVAKMGQSVRSRIYQTL